jgi:hypothetical protein
MISRRRFPGVCCGFVVPSTFSSFSNHHNHQFQSRQNQQFISAAPMIFTNSRFISDATLQATKDLPKTPGGQNAFKVMDMDVTKETTNEMLTKQFKALAVKCHPDRPGGSNEAMAELNAAFKITKENLTAAMDKLTEVKRHKSANAEFHKMNKQRADKEEDIGRTGGIYSAKRVNVVREQMNKFKSAKDLAAHWDQFQADTTEDCGRMINRLEVAIEQCLHFKKITMLHEISVRERWLRRMFVKNIWESVHELRQELLRKGARSQQQTMLAEEMVAFATATERKLTEDFHRQAQVMIQGQLRVIMGRATSLVITVCLSLWIMKTFMGFIYNNSFSVRYKKGFFGHD